MESCDPADIKSKLVQDRRSRRSPLGRDAELLQQSIFDAAVAHTDDSVAVGGGLGIVGNHENRLTDGSVQVAEKVQNGGGVGGIQVAGGLIGKEDRGIIDNGAGQGDALLFAAAHLRWAVIHTLVDAQQLGDVRDVIAVGERGMTAGDIEGNLDVAFR
jgi:hypothetical protein